VIRIILPVYNEAKNIRKCIKEIASNTPGSYKIYAINDGSKDNSLEILHKLRYTYPVTVINHKVNKGIAEAFKSGISSVLKEGKIRDIVIIMESDCTSDPTLLKKLINKIKTGYDIAIASRYIDGGGYMRFPLRRLILSRSANTIFRALYQSKGVADYTIFYRAYSYKVLKKASEKFDKRLITTKYFAANAELLVKLLTITDKATEIPFVYDYGKKKGKSGLNVKKNLNQYLRFIVYTKITHR
jgi:dolichol-phosphate mannosyltransferase